MHINILAASKFGHQQAEVYVFQFLCYAIWPQTGSLAMIWTVRPSIRAELCEGDLEVVEMPRGESYNCYEG